MEGRGRGEGWRGGVEGRGGGERGGGCIAKFSTGGVLHMSWPEDGDTGRQGGGEGAKR